MRHPHREAIYRAAQRFVDSVLRSDDSIFTPGEPIWTAANVQDVYQRFNLQPDETDRTFEQKLRDQLDGAPPASYQLFAESIFTCYLVVADIKGATKRKLIDEVLSWSPEPVQVPADLGETLDRGLAATGLAYKTLRPFQLWFLIEFVRKWKGLEPEVRAAALEDPWKFTELLNDTPIDKGYAQREALKHLVFPDTFEDMVSREYKKAIAQGFADLVSEPTDDIDRQLLQMRSKLSERHGERFVFYDPELWVVWNPHPMDPEKLGTFFYWGQRLFERDDFDEEERNYKLELAGMLASAKEALRAGSPEWLELIDKAFKSPLNNLTNWRGHQPFLDWCRSSPEEAGTSLAALWDEPQGFSERIDNLEEHTPTDLLTAGFLPILSVLMMAVDAPKYPPLRATTLKRGLDLTGYPPYGAATDPIRRYRHGVTFLENLLREGRGHGAQLRDRLDAQGVLWWIAQGEPPKDWSEEDRRAFVAWREGRGEPAGVVEGERVRAEPGPIGELAARLYLPEEFLTDTVSLLSERKQLIFYGPPGTGKTFVARKLIEHLAPEPERREIVQFHPSYSYEDFVQGYRPLDKDGELVYELKPGPLVRLAERAAASDRDHYLMIDEINRGNLPKIFGELLYLLEYRADEVTLMYEDEKPFALPPNLLILGTMNTADRSIGLIDAAARRRFHFVALFPSEEPLEGLLREWLEENNPEMAFVADVVDRLNARLRPRLGRHLQVGHSYFMRKDLTEEVLNQIWEHDIIPFLEDQFYGHEKDLEEFTLPRLREPRDADHPSEGTREEGGEALGE